MMMNRMIYTLIRIIICSVLLTQFLLVSALTGRPTSRRSILRDQILLPIVGSTAAIACTPSGKAVAIESAQLLSGADTTDPGIPNGVLWRTGSKQALPATPSSLAKIMDIEVMGTMSTASSGIICISERHDDFEHHKIQLKVLMTMKKALSERSQNVSENLSIGMEMFQRQHQKFLDQYIEELDYGIRDLQRETNWDTTWGYDILHYLPILLFAKKHGIHIVGLHPSDEQVEYVKQEAISNYGYCKEAIDIAVTLFREEYMAENAAIQMNRQPYGWVALLAGERHILRRDGLPSRALRTFAEGRRKFSKNFSAMQPSRGVFTIAPKVISFPIAAYDTVGIESADYVWYVQRDSSTEFREDKVNNAPRI
jgi:hypothetical protein